MLESAPFVDLLGGAGRRRIQGHRLRQVLTFAFASGGEQEQLSSALSGASFGDTLWSAECFGGDLFLETLIERCLWRGRLPLRSSLRPGIRAYLLSALSAPPAGPDALSIVRFRQEISAELAERSGLLERVIGLSVRLERVFELMEAGGLGVRLDATRRSLDILTAVRDAVEEAARFSDVTSGLSGIAAWAREVRASDGYRNLESLLDYEARQANVTVNVRLGRQGELRGLDVLSVRENVENPHHVSPLGRFLGRFNLWFRGFRLREAEVFGRLIHDVFEGVMGFFPAALQLMADLEFYRLGVSLSRFAAERGLATCLPSFGSERRVLDDLFNPFLLLEERPPRPCDVATGGWGTVVVLTGPNSGGKTRLIQALGLCQVLGQAGLFVPAREASLPWQDGLFASLGIEITAEQREGRLGTELMRIRRMFEKLEMGSLVLVDELCAGTNPAEAERLFGMVLELLHELSAHAFVTTHFLEYAARLARERPQEDLEFLCVELDADDHPTYRFRPGVAETALAQQTASRLGVTLGELTELVRLARERREERRRVAAAMA